MSWRVPEQGKGESKQHYRDKLNRSIDDYRRYTESASFPDWQRDRFRRRIRQLEKAVRALLEPGAGSG